MSHTVKWMLVFIVILALLTPALVYEAGPHPHRVTTLVAGDINGYFASNVPVYYEDINSVQKSTYLYVQLNVSPGCAFGSFPFEFEVRVVGVSLANTSMLYVSLQIASINYENESRKAIFISENNFDGTELIYFYEAMGFNKNSGSVSDLFLNGSIGVYYSYGPFSQAEKCFPLDP
ncbi:MAG: hypothetical protein LVQ96_07675 [Thermoplasmatales archaeon]|nr:hypothetical protein [Thermoplasmatales archaeon]MCW6171034.1 hypothetical protein [Thermoplasmatales archaeon]